MIASSHISAAQSKIDYLLGKADHADRHARDWAERGSALQVSRWTEEAERLRRRAKLIPMKEFWLVAHGAELEPCADFGAAVETAEEIGPEAEILSVRGSVAADVTAEARDARLTMLMRSGALDQASDWARGL